MNEQTKKVAEITAVEAIGNTDFSKRSRKAHKATSGASSKTPVSATNSKQSSKKINMAAKHTESDPQVGLDASLQHSLGPVAQPPDQLQGADLLSTQAWQTAHGAPFDTGPFNMPWFYPPHMPMNSYGGFGSPFPFPPAGSLSQDVWDTQSLISHSSSRPVHDMSDEEDEPENANIEATAEPPTITREGRFGDLLREQLKEEDATVTLGPKADENLAKLIQRFFTAPKPMETLHAVVKDYKRPENLPVLQTAKLETEILAAIDNKEKATDTALSTTHKGVTAAIIALLPVAQLMLTRGKEDDALDGLSENIIDALRVLTATSVHVAGKRRENLKSAINTDYAKLLNYRPDTPEWLFGGDLQEATRQCELSQKLMDKISRKRAATSGQGKTFISGRQTQGFRGRQHFGGGRPYMQPRYFTPNAYGYPYSRMMQPYMGRQRQPWLGRDQRPAPPRAPVPETSALGQPLDFQRKGPRK